MQMLDLIAKRRDGKPHDQQELRFLAGAAAESSVPDYQLSAWLMAAYLNPLSEQETAWLTVAMAESGERVDLTGLPKPWVDKHSTGGVGDKTTLVLLPILAACGLTVVKMSGRGLGNTGGTVDKLSSIPGLRLDLSPEQMKAQAGQIGIALTGQSPKLAPADKALYALRDVTGTVASIPLIVSSIVSKKIAGGAETVIFDVKCGSGSFMKELSQAQELRRWLERIGNLAGLNTRAEISDMCQPLGSAVGNSLEVLEAIQVLRGSEFTPPVARFRELCVHYAALALESSGEASGAEARARVDQALYSGAAFEKAQEWLMAQGAPPELFDHNQQLLPKAPVRRVVGAPEAGWLARIGAETVGLAVLDLGGGRKRKDDEIDPRVGIEVLAIVGQRVARGEPVFYIHASSDAAAAEAERSLLGGLVVLADPVEPVPLFLT